MLEGLIKQSQGHDQFKLDYGPYQVSQVGFDNDTADLVLPPSLDSLLFNGGEPVVLPYTDHAFGQIAQKLGVAAFPGRDKSLDREYLSACPGWLRAVQLNHWAQHVPDKSGNRGEREWFVRSYRDQARAVLSGDYVKVDVTETLKWVQEALESRGDLPGLRLVRPYVSPDVLHLRILFQDINTGPGGNYGVGGYFTTGEIGNRRIGAHSLIQRFSCENSIIVPSNEFSYEHNHTGNRLVISKLFQAAIFEVLKGSMAALKRLLDSQEEQLPKFGEYVEDLAKQYGWTTAVKYNVLIGSEGEESLFGLVNGVSGAANKEEDPDRQVELQELAGQFLFHMKRERVPVGEE